MTLISKILPTTVVGSYPVVAKKGLLTLDPLKHAVEVAVADQLEAGIDIISDGQVRGDMVQAFTSRLPGIKGQSVVGKVQPPAKPLTAADTRYALSKHAKVKGILTGPSTLAHALKIDTPMYRNREELALDLAQALAAEAKHLEAAGVTLVQIDEPIFSTGAADLAAGRQAVNAIVSSVRVPTCLHVCGGLDAVVDEVLKVNVSVLDFEFAVSPGNIEILSERDLRGRSVGYGCVDSSSATVESTETIARRIEAGIDVFGAKAMLVDPDCGLRMQSRETAFGKLKNMVAAAKDLRTEYS